MDDNHTPDIDHPITMRANVLRNFVDRSQTRSPVKPGPVSPPTLQPSQKPPFLVSILSLRGPPIPSPPPPRDVKSQLEEVDRVEDDVDRVEDDVAATETHESSTEDTGVGFIPTSSFPTHSFVSSPTHIA